MPFILTRIPVHFWFITKVNMENAALNESFPAGPVVLVINVAQRTAGQFRDTSAYVLCYIERSLCPFGTGPIRALIS